MRSAGELVAGVWGGGGTLQNVNHIIEIKTNSQDEFWVGTFEEACGDSISVSRWLGSKVEYHPSLRQKALPVVLTNNQTATECLTSRGHKDDLTC